ncbi:MAG: bifunctional phosphoribosylaminoimidazolecarboxamide formyltransferase/IMP cyclohydrolase [Holophagales bacterium]|nr:bifunctional phosphoribosylaminoimidazolecarboxamide formyltransferase/IMP cyclohydrolase [Holophagales bacterium]
MSTKRALLSVSDRSGLLDLANALLRHDFELVSTGGTGKHLSDAGLPVTQVADVTGFPEVFDGRVKTLHPALFGGVLYDRSVPKHVEQAGENGIGPIDVVVVNLYPFEETVASASTTFAQGIEKIDVGGPSLLRAAAKNHAHVAVLCDPADYPAFAAELDANRGGSTLGTRKRLAGKVFRRTAAYDAAISAWLAARTEGEAFPERLPLSFELGGTLRYGENPHQAGAFYRDPAAPPSALARFVLHQGKELSYTNLLDADSALFTSRLLPRGALTIVKHRIPCGIAREENAAPTFEAAWASDPVSGFGGVLAYTGVLDRAAAEAMTTKFLEVVVCEGVTDEARAVFARKPNLRLLSVAPDPAPRARRELRGIDGGLLVQEADVLPGDETTWKVVTKRVPTDGEMRALRFLERAVAGVISNAIVIGGETATFGIGGGRTSRVDAAGDAVGKAGERAKGACAASDAFFPFPDGLLLLAEAGVTACVEPGGSVKDAEVIAAADERGMALVFSGRRHFRH